MMSTHPILYLYTPSEDDAWRNALSAALPEAEVMVWPQTIAPQRVEYMAVWRPPPGLFASFPALKAVFALSAGVDTLLTNPDLPPHVQIIRLRDAGMAAQMLEYVLYAVLRHHRDFDLYAARQAQARWDAARPTAAADIRVTVLGLGAIGGAVATALAQFGYGVAGWSRSQRDLPGVQCHNGPDALMPLLKVTDVLVNLLPSTPETQGLIDADALAALPVGATLVHCGRGDQADETALLAALDRGHLRGAVLDVFAAEPLHADSPLWGHPRVLVTPHVAATSLPGPSARQVAQSFRDLVAGRPTAGLVDRLRSY